MTQEQKQVRDWMAQFGQATPSKPTIPDLATRKLRAKLILEEALETVCRGLGVTPVYDKNTDTWDFPSNACPPSLIEIADGCSDLKVVTEGTLVACGLVELDKIHFDNAGCWSGCDPLFNEVMRSNQSKLWTIADIQDVRNGHNVTSFGALSTPEFDNRFEITNVAEDRYLVKDKDGKVIKSPSYSPANLQPIIDQL